MEATISNDETFTFQSYMEDHLKNKNRLEKEWEALCAYQAEPNATTIARKEENAQKNRSYVVIACTYSLNQVAYFLLSLYQWLQSTL